MDYIPLRKMVAMTTKPPREPQPPASLSKSYDASDVEERLYKWWESSGFFSADPDPARRPFTIIMPPPNVTGELHLGHASRAAVEDALTRYHRMLGDVALYLPGADHAGIATQMVVERDLAKRGLNRHELGREAFVKHIWDWVHKYGNIIDNQHRRLGVSCDWRRKTFTLDPGPVRAVRTTFKRLYDKGLIYRGERMINWCVGCRTALSDLEVDHFEEQGNLYYIRYPLEDGSGHLTVATTRPETLLGDTAVAVNPSDERYTGLSGKQVLLPILGRPIPIIEDAAVSMEFGTGAVKITPGHDPNDFETGQRHDLPIVNILNPDGTLNQNAGPYEGVERFAARKAIVEQLEREGLLERVEPHLHSVGHCQRSADIVEPIVSLQWFVHVEPLAKRALDAVRDGRITIVPDRFEKVYANWMENIRDWCISRQLWWGHRIPVWYCADCDHVTVAIDDPVVCEGCGSTYITQDEDVLDTWFSSGLWPHSTLGWPDETEDLKYFYPTSVMETAYDILFFWVARMIMLGLENTDDVPFRTVYLSGLIRDAHGQKMSKTRGNVIDPLESIKEYGTDALRFALSTGTAPGNDTRLSPARLQAARNFTNKLWNVTRFVLTTLDSSREAEAASSPPPEGEGQGGGETPAPQSARHGQSSPPPETEGADVILSEAKNLTAPSPLGGWYDAPPRDHREDRWILGRLDQVTEEVHRLWDAFQLGEIQRLLHDFIWSEYADWYIELAKVRLRAGDEAPRKVLAHVLERSLRLLHPFMPFITEELWQHLTAALPPVPVASVRAPGSPDQRVGASRRLAQGRVPVRPEREAVAGRTSGPHAPASATDPDDLEGRRTIMLAPYPMPSDAAPDERALAEVSLLTDVIRAIRNVRAEFRVEPTKQLDAVVNVPADGVALREAAEAIRQLARVGTIAFGNAGPSVGGETPAAPADTVKLVVGQATVMLSMGDSVDVAAERKRLADEAQQTTRYLSGLEARLNNEQFTSKAPEDVVERERQRLEDGQARLARIRELLRDLGG